MKASTSREDMEKMVERDEVQDATNEAQLTLLRNAVEALYYAAVWHADRRVDEQALWMTVRDAAGFRPGRGPKEVAFDGIRVAYGIDRLRQIGHLASAKKGREFGTTETRALLLLYGAELQDRLDETVRKFLEEKLS
jgi:hypothetical protein